MSEIKGLNLLSRPYIFWLKDIPVIIQRVYKKLLLTTNAKYELKKLEDNNFRKKDYL